MPTPPPLGVDTLAIAQRMEQFEASASVKNTGTGSRREGAGFERLVGELWEALRRHAVERQAACTFVRGVGNRRWAKLTIGQRSLYLPNNPSAPLTDAGEQPSRWLEVEFIVSDLIAKFPTESEAIKRYAPATGPFARSNYPAMYSGLYTSFDDTVVLEDAGVLREKILMEYKTAKSSKKRQLDANVHERCRFR